MATSSKSGGTKTPVEQGKTVLPTKAVNNVQGKSELGKKPEQQKAY